MEDFGKIIYEAKLKKNTIGMKPKQVAEILLRDDIENIIVLEKEGRTDKGYEFNTVTIYSKKTEATNGN